MASSSVVVGNVGDVSFDICNGCVLNTFDFVRISVLCLFFHFYCVDECVKMCVFDGKKFKSLD